MSVPTPEELLVFLQEHGILTPPQVQQLRDGSDTKFADARVLARELVDRNWLTPYQANQLLLGHGADLLVGSYHIVDRLGEGGMGQVFKAHHVSMDRLVALKIISKDRVSNPTAVARFYREVRAVAKLSHPNIVIAFEVNQVGQTPFLAMEYVEGIDLAKLVQQSGPLPIPRACDYIRQAALGLQHAHEKGLVHRDIKPGNLMVTRYGPDAPPLIKILDFGLARFESESDHTTRLTQLGKVVGTVDYMAPEQAQNARTADIRADIYGLGCTLFHLLTGRPPFHGHDTIERIGARVLGNLPSIRQSRPEASPALEQVIAKMTARDPLERYQMPGQVVKALEPYAQSDRDKRRAARTVVDREAVRPPTFPAFIEAPLAVPLLPAKVITWQQAGERELRAPKSKLPVGLALVGMAAFGAVAVLAIFVGAIVLFADSRARDSKGGDSAKGPTLAHQNTKMDKTKLADPGDKAGPVEPKKQEPVTEPRKPDNDPKKTAPKVDENLNELAKFDGKWAVAFQMLNGQRMADAAVNNYCLVIKDGKISYQTNGVEWRTATLTVDGSKSPAESEVRIEDGGMKGEVYKSIYKFEGDRLTFCTASAGGGRPTKFESKRGANTWLEVCVKVK